MNRKIFHAFVLVVLFFTLFTVDLDARISSRIKGRVVDEKTGETLTDVTVRLYYFLEGRSFATKRTKTDVNGAGRIILSNKKIVNYQLPMKTAKVCYSLFP